MTSCMGIGDPPPLPPCVHLCLPDHCLSLHRDWRRDFAHPPKKRGKRRRRGTRAGLQVKHCRLRNYSHAANWTDCLLLDCNFTSLHQPGVAWSRSPARSSYLRTVFPDVPGGLLNRDPPYTIAGIVVACLRSELSSAHPLLSVKIQLSPL